MNSSVLLTTSYLPPIQYFTKLIQYNSIIVEQWEHYGKQSYRNRFNILTSNGVQSFSIPVKNSNKVYTKDVLIDYSNRWQAIHIGAIEAAYRSSAYFIYYFDSLVKIYNEKTPLLLDFNNKLLNFICSEIGIRTSISYTTDYVSNPDIIDLRNSIHPKPHKCSIDNSFCSVEYYQVFAHKFGFSPNLSIIDLLFNCGPESILVLNNCTRF